MAYLHFTSAMTYFLKFAVKTTDLRDGDYHPSFIHIVKWMKKTNRVVLGSSTTIVPANLVVSQFSRKCLKYIYSSHQLRNGRSEMGSLKAHFIYFRMVSFVWGYDFCCLRPEITSIWEASIYWYEFSSLDWAKMYIQTDLPKGIR